MDLKLNNAWVMFDHEKSNNEDYERSTRILGTFKTVGEFLFLQSKFPKPSTLFYIKDVGKNYYEFPDNAEREISSISVFREGIFPRWEDEHNFLGGELSFRKFTRKGMSIQECLDECWNTIVIHCISEQFINSQLITGVRVVDSSINNNELKRQVYRIEIWFSDLSYKNVLQHELKNLFNIPITDLYFKEHSPAASKVVST